MTDIHKKEEMTRKIVVSEIEGKNIKPDEIYTKDENMLDQQQMSAVKVEKVDTLWGGKWLRLNSGRSIAARAAWPTMLLRLFSDSLEKQCWDVR